MAFANLFKGLSPVVEDVKSPAQPVSTLRNQTDGKRDTDRKRKTQCEQPGHYGKKQLHQAQAARATFGSFHMHNTGSEHGFTREVMHSHSHNNMGHKGQNYKPKNNSHVTREKQEPKKKSEWQKNQHQHKNRGRTAYKGGGHQTRPTWKKGGGDRKNKNFTWDFQVKRPRFMTQEFKDQNVLLVDGRLLCRHFLWGKCIKGDECQLEHIEGYNDLFKEVCKYYVQGCCSKGESCPYMHKSFPCKFFHRKGKCSQGADCRFSHEPLNDVTKQLLDEALKRDNDLYELAKKAEQKSSEQPANTDESEVTEAIPDIFKEPLRPNFYKSAEINTEKGTLFCQTEEQAAPLHTSDAAQLHSPPSTNPVNEEPVCYSVEAVLGPQRSKLFTSFVRTPRSQESTCLSSSDCTSDSVNQSQVPYSVDAVLRSCKENSTFGHSPTPPTEQTMSYTPKSYFEEIHDPLSSSDNQNKKDLRLLNTRYEGKKSQEKCFKSLSFLQGHTGLASMTYQNLTLTSGNHIKQSGNLPQTHKPAERPLNEIKEELHLPLDITASRKSEGILPFGPRHQTSVSKHPTQLKPHFPVQPLDSEASFKPMCPSSDLTESKGRTAVPAETVTSSIKSNSSKSNIVSCYFAPEQPIEIHLHSKKTQCSLTLGTEHFSTETTAVCTSKMAHCGDLAVGCEKPLKRPFHSLFASPIVDTVQPLDDPVTSSSCAQSLIRSSYPVPQSADCRLNLKPGKASARSFLSLFAAPVSAPPLPHMQSQPDYSRTSSCSDHSVDNLSHSSGIRALNLETPLPRQVRTEEISYTPRSPCLSPNAKKGKDHVVNPVCSPVRDSVSEMSTSPPRCGNSSSPTHVHQQQPDISSHKATANSVLKTLFLCLSPYQQDGKQQDSIQISVPTESEKKDESSTVCVKQLQKSQKKDRRKKKLEIPTDSPLRK
ncbi:Zinc finger CCCH domain-containing protein 6 [Larimichthys crocea]|uniref:Zinc finger CCCH domain-containing protein 6 n=1 Tax=Larimichthys crocea TaxID=215358 RepID=A0A6G0JBU1_LARCR|nr:uncharacterized protein LOC104920394 isoform X2 [Larimichthys crocea]KAE8301013.1 Zinc finger CCCH domain-containing protein 6 [Larimichthys crocea]